MMMPVANAIDTRFTLPTLARRPYVPRLRDAGRTKGCLGKKSGEREDGPKERGERYA